MPSSPSRQTELARLIAKPFAHRGLHGEGRIENSRAAFEAAIAAGHGIELDVQATAHGEPVVFHDYQLDRLTDSHGCVADLDFEETGRIRLSGSDETIPSLAEILALIGGRVPLLIEVKSDSAAFHQLCYWIAGCLRQYRGPVGLMSFNPRVGHWFARHHPKLLRGLVVSEQGKSYLRGWMERWFSLFLASPDFLAYDLRDLPARFAEARRAGGMKVLTWTVRTAADRARAAAHADQIIFEAPAR
jgi:glycerophosphoryl diester phosphodiesterase